MEWSARDQEFELEWAGRLWVLRPREPGPGLRVRGGTAGPLLSLDGLAAEGRTDPGAFSGPSLTSLTSAPGRVEASYGAWPGLTVHAAWVVAGDDAVDLEVRVELQDGAAGVLRGFEVKAASVLPEPAGSKLRRWVEPRDGRAAALSYDGRESSLQGLTTLPPADGTLAPRMIPSPWDDGLVYVEMVDPADVARRVTEAGKISSLGYTTRYGLFGVDLAPGTVLRTRLRGVWLLSASPQREALERAEAFLSGDGSPGA